MKTVLDLLFTVPDRHNLYIKTKNPKPDRIFDTLENTDRAADISVRRSKTGKENILIEHLFRLAYQYSYRRSIKNRGRYFLYKKETARIARSGSVGNNAYYYSLGDPNADSRPLTIGELYRLDRIERFAYRHRHICFWGFIPIPLSYAYYVFYYYINYENILPIAALPFAGIVIAYWIKLVNIADGCSIKVLPETVTVFSKEQSSKIREN